jgi:hypothetical protein
MVFTDSTLKEKLLPMASGQQQVVDASPSYCGVRRYECLYSGER